MLPTLKSTIKSRVPFVATLWRKLRSRGLAGQNPQNVFSRIYQTNYWGDASSASGTGSNLIETEVIRATLPRWLAELECRTMLDIPCGDLYWMKLLDLDVDYTGADIVPELIARNTELYAGPRRNFRQLDLTTDALPAVDLIFCRDCLVHLSFAHLRQAIANIRRSGARYLMTTTFVDRRKNPDIQTGDWRPLNLQCAPFHFPAPLRIENEACPQPGFGDKAIALWKIADLPEMA
jgi:hypothetical protein